MQNDRVERQTLVATDRTPPAHVLEAVEQSIETRPNRPHFAGQRVCALVCRAERARSAVVGKIRAERLRPALRARSDRFGELELIFAGHLVHDSLPSFAFYASTWRPAPVRKRPLCVACHERASASPYGGRVEWRHFCRSGRLDVRPPTVV